MASTPMNEGCEDLFSRCDPVPTFGPDYVKNYLSGYQIMGIDIRTAEDKVVPYVFEVRKQNIEMLELLVYDFLVKGKVPDVAHYLAQTGTLMLWALIGCFEELHSRIRDIAPNWVHKYEEYPYEEFVGEKNLFDKVELTDEDRKRFENLLPNIIAGIQFICNLALMRAKHAPLNAAQLNKRVTVFFLLKLGPVQKEPYAQKVVELLGPIWEKCQLGAVVINSCSLLFAIIGNSIISTKGRIELDYARSMLLFTAMTWHKELRTAVQQYKFTKLFRTAEVLGELESYLNTIGKRLPQNSTGMFPFVGMLGLLTNEELSPMRFPTLFAVAVFALAENDKTGSSADLVKKYKENAAYTHKQLSEEDIRRLAHIRLHVDRTVEAQVYPEVMKHLKLPALSSEKTQDDEINTYKKEVQIAMLKGMTSFMSSFKF